MSQSYTASAPVGRFDLELCVSSGQVFRWRRLEDGTWLGVDGDQWYHVRTPDHAPAMKSAWNAGERQLDSLAYAAERRRAYTAASETYAVESNAGPEAFERLFRLDWDADAIEKEIQHRAPELKPYLGTLTGLRLMRPSDPVEMFFCFLCSPNNNLSRIMSMCRHLASYGPVLGTVADHELHRFPSVETVAAVPEPELWSAGFGYRARTIPNIAHQVLDRGGAAWIEGLKAVPYEEAHRELCGLNGIGPKLADCIALFALHHTHAAPVDTHLWQALTRLYFPEWKDKSITEQRYYAASNLLRSKLGELTGWGHQYLFYDNLLNWRTRRATAKPRASAQPKKGSSQ